MNDTDKMIPWFSHEAEVSRLERVIKRLWISGFVVFLAFVISNILWLNYEMQYEDVITTEIEATQDGGGVNIVGGGDVAYGTESKNQDNKITP